MVRFAAAPFSVSAFYVRAVVSGFEPENLATVVVADGDGLWPTRLQSARSTSLTAF
jgi:hypothetical protein